MSHSEFEELKSIIKAEFYEMRESLNRLVATVSKGVAKREALEALEEAKAYTDAMIDARMIAHLAEEHGEA